MSDDLARTLLADLSRFEDEVEEADKRAREARERVERQRRLVADMRSQYPDWFSEDDRAEATSVASKSASHALTSGFEPPRGRDAVWTVVNESIEQKLSTTQILDEMTVRGWASDKDPEGAIRAAIRRLQKDGRLVKLDEKDGRAFVYAIEGGKSDTPASAGVSVDTSSSAVGAAGPDSEGGDGDDGGHRDHYSAPVMGAS